MSNRFSVRDAEKQISEEDSLDDLFADDAEEEVSPPEPPPSNVVPIEEKPVREKLDLTLATPDEEIEIDETIEEFIDDDEDVIVDEVTVTETPRNLHEESIEEKLKRVQNPGKKKKEAWKPSAEALAELPETQMQAPVYNTDEFIKDNTGPTFLIDNAEEQYRNDIAAESNVLTRASKNIEFFKHRHGIAKIEIPDERFHMEIMNAASDPDINRAQSGLDTVIEDMMKLHPTAVYFFPTEEEKQTADIIDISDMVPPEKRVVTQTTDSSFVGTPPSPIVNSIEVTIDKRQEDDLSFSDDEKEKLLRSEVIKLNVIQDENIPASEIEDVDISAIKSVMNQYTRKVGDIDTALPASRYRATFCGMSYRESLDMMAIDALNKMDSEKYKWTVVFNHMYNMSIGDWEEYRYYKDKNGKEIRLGPNDPIPPDVPAANVQVHSKFDDFLMKTSYIDLEYMLWKILCATNNDTETMNITCNHVIGQDENGEDVLCNHEYDQKYKPSELLLMEDVDPVVLEEMNRTASADTTKDIMENFNDGPVMNTHLIRLPDSGYQVIYGHMSAYEWLNSVFGKVQEIIEQFRMGDITQDQSSIQLLMMELLKVVKGFLIPKTDGEGWYRITGMDNILGVIDTLSNTDWKVIGKLTEKIVIPYTMTFKVKDSRCPKCGFVQDIPIDDLSRILFFMVQRQLYQGVEF